MLHRSSPPDAPTEFSLQMSRLGTADSIRRGNEEGVFGVYHFASQLPEQLIKVDESQTLLHFLGCTHYPAAWIRGLELRVDGFGSAAECREENATGNPPASAMTASLTFSSLWRSREPRGAGPCVFGRSLPWRPPPIWSSLRGYAVSQDLIASGPPSSLCFGEVVTDRNRFGVR